MVIAVKYAEVLCISACLSQRTRKLEFEAA